MIIYAINYFMLSTVFFFYKLQPGERTDATTRKARSRAAICEQRGHPLANLFTQRVAVDLVQRHVWPLPFEPCTHTWDWPGLEIKNHTSQPRRIGATPHRKQFLSRTLRISRFAFPQPPQWWKHLFVISVPTLNVPWIHAETRCV